MVPVCNSGAWLRIRVLVVGRGLGLALDILGDRTEVLQRDFDAFGALILSQIHWGGRV